MSDLARLKNSIKHHAEMGRDLRKAATHLFHQEKSDLQRKALQVGEDARVRLLAYQILQGKHPALAESPTCDYSKIRYSDLPRRVVSLVEMYASGTAEEKAKLVAKAEADLGLWVEYVQAKDPTLQEDLRMEASAEVA